MKLKRWISIFLVLALLVGAVACGEKGATKETQEAAKETGEATNETEQSIAQDPPEGDQEPEEAVLVKSKLKEFKQFKATTLDGKEFTQEDLKKVDLTLIDFWQTGCAPCIAQFPQLAKLHKILPKNVQMISACFDAQGKEDLVKKILSDNGLDTTTIVSGDGDWEREDKNVQFTPTYILVDGEGNVVGEIMGTSLDEKAVDEFKTIINDTLKKLGKPTF